MDGAQRNCTFMHIKIGKNATSMIAQNPCGPEQSAIFMIDSPHVLKKNQEQYIKEWNHKRLHLQLSSGELIHL